MTAISKTMWKSLDTVLNVKTAQQKRRRCQLIHQGYNKTKIQIDKTIQKGIDHDALFITINAKVTRYKPRYKLIRPFKNFYMKKYEMDVSMTHF